MAKPKLKLAMIDRLHKSGCLDDRQHAACNAYIEIVGDQGHGFARSPNLVRGIGERASTIQTILMVNALASIRANDLRSCLPDRYRGPFEAIAIHNQPIGKAAKPISPTPSLGAVSNAGRAMMRECAERIRLKLDEASGQIQTGA